jgi:hypothetical protein
MSRPSFIPSSLSGRAPLLLGLLVSGLLSSGCGLAAYEDKMKEAQDNLLAFEDEDKLLGEPIDYSARDREGPAVFLRLPKGIKIRGELHPFSNQPYFHYLPEGKDSPFQEILVAGVAPAAPSDTTVQLRTEKMPPRTDNLAEKVLGRYGLREPTGTVSIRRLSRSLLRAQSFTAEKPLYIVTGYLDQEDFNQVAIVFHIDKSRKDETVDKLMKTTLRSLAVGADADKARNLFEHRHRQRASGTAPVRP